MTGAEDLTPDVDDVDSRAELLPEEVHAGSENPEAQARAVLADSAERTADPEGTGARSVQTAPPEKRA